MCVCVFLCVCVCVLFFFFFSFLRFLFDSFFLPLLFISFSDFFHKLSANEAKLFFHCSQLGIRTCEAFRQKSDLESQSARSVWAR